MENHNPERSLYKENYLIFLSNLSLDNPTEPLIYSSDFTKLIAFVVKELIFKLIIQSK